MRFSLQSLINPILILCYRNELHRERGPYCHLKNSKGDRAAGPRTRHLCQVINLIQSREDLLVQIHHLSIRPRQSNWIGHVEQGKLRFGKKTNDRTDRTAFTFGSFCMLLDRKWRQIVEYHAGHAVNPNLKWNLLTITLAGRLPYRAKGLYCQLDKCHFETATTASPGQVLTQAGTHIVNMHRCMRYIQIRSIILHWATNHPWSRVGLT